MDTRLIFRFDDIGEANHTAFQFIDLMETLERSYLLAVIPDALGRAMKRRLREARYAAVFQHGANHENHSSPEAPDEFPAEWGHRTISDQLARGRHALEDALGIAVTGYVPPWNRISPVVLRVLEDQGYQTLSADALYSTSLCQVPVHVDVYSSYFPVTVRSDQDIERDIAANLERTALVGVMLHPMTVPRESSAQLERMLHRNRHRMVADSPLRTAKRKP
jgi:peptidoglycan/xylan/chitin deacetylase (PgdA/CDA1 family)